MDAARSPKLDVRAVALEHYNERTQQALLVLDRIDLQVAEGELVSIVGPSGCGKTTFLNAVDGLVRVTGGEIRVDGRVVDRPGPDRAFVFQHDSLFPWRTVMQNVSYGLELQGRTARSEMRERVRAMVELVGLRGFEDHYPHELSGGMRQRVNIARALVVNPELLLLDEPFAALDAFTREELWCVIRDLHAARGITVVLVTHDLREAVFLADRVFVMSARPGRVLAERRIDIPRPRDLEVTFRPEFQDIVHELRAHIVRARQ